jgi:hypothetical protein
MHVFEGRADFALHVGADGFGKDANGADMLEAGDKQGDGGLLVGKAREVCCFHWFFSYECHGKEVQEDKEFREQICAQENRSIVAWLHTQVSCCLACLQKQMSCNMPATICVCVCDSLLTYVPFFSKTIGMPLYACVRKHIVGASRAFLYFC